MAGVSFTCSDYRTTIIRMADDDNRIVRVDYSDERGTTTLYRRREDCAPTWPECECEHCRRLAALEKVVEAARVICDDMKACRMPYASTMVALDTALAALDAEVVG